MTIVRDERPSDSPLVRSISRVRYLDGADDVTTPDGCWDIVVIRPQSGRVLVLQTGPITKPVTFRREAGDEHLVITFEPGVFMPNLPGIQMIDRGVIRPNVNRRSFQLDANVLEIPTFDNAEGLVARFVQRGLIARDHVVDRILRGQRCAVGPRSVQRHFMHALGMRPKYLEQILRAREAVDLLARGTPLTEAAFAVGYSDHAHMTRSLKRIMGRTPSEIVRAPTG